MYQEKGGIKLDIGCGAKWRESKQLGFEGVDIHDFGQKYVLDVRKGLPFKDNEVDFIRAEHFLEHLTNDEVIAFLNECWRVLKGAMHVVVPSVSVGGKAYVLQHKSFYTEETFKSLERDDGWEIYGIRRWKVYSVKINERGDIHAYLIPLK